MLIETGCLCYNENKFIRYMVNRDNFKLIQLIKSGFSHYFSHY